MLNIIDFKKHINTYDGYLAEDFISKVIGVRKYHLKNVVNRLMKNGVITANSIVPLNIKNSDNYERGFELIDVMIIFGKYRNTKSFEALKLCKELLHA